MDKQMQYKVRILNHTTEMQPSTKNILLDLVTFLNTRTAEAAKLWWVLTALRGPDNDSNRTKTATTCVIRDAVGLREGVGKPIAVGLGEGVGEPLPVAVTPVAGQTCGTSSAAAKGHTSFRMR